MLLKSQLNQKGFFQIEEANSGESAVRVSREKGIDFIIMDVKLKGKMNGIEAMQSINVHRVIPFVLVSAYQDMDQELLTKVPGFSGFFPKPLTEQHLYRIKVLIDEVLSN